MYHFRCSEIFHQSRRDVFNVKKINSRNRLENKSRPRKNWNVDSAFYRLIINSRFSIIEQTTVLTAAQDICSLYLIIKFGRISNYSLT